MEKNRRRGLVFEANLGVFEKSFERVSAREALNGENAWHHDAQKPACAAECAASHGTHTSVKSGDAQCLSVKCADKPDDRNTKPYVPVKSGETQSQTVNVADRTDTSDKEKDFPVTSWRR